MLCKNKNKNNGGLLTGLLSSMPSTPTMKHSYKILVIIFWSLKLSCWKFVYAVVVIVVVWTADKQDNFDFIRSWY